ncbi:MAG TPA: ribulose-phosphate 3-epimerase [Acholeplasmataceae bacterium]|nr:ribulose-phosphate 3-epimerase [Acholeplasmataceae bacterium]
MIVAPSLLACDFSNLEKEAREVVDCGAQFLHIDVMDGHFVPNITLGPVIYKNLKGKVDAVFDVHLMISDPKFYAKAFIDAGADYLTFHYEAVEDVKDVINHIKSLGCKVGISIKPNTKVEVLDEYLSLLDLVLVMSVEPGFGGQKFIPSALEKIKYLSDKKKKNNYKYLIEVDGGINDETAKQCVNAGVEVLVAGTYIFASKDRSKTIEGLLNL